MEQTLWQQGKEHNTHTHDIPLPFPKETSKKLKEDLTEMDHPKGGTGGSMFE